MSSSSRWREPVVVVTVAIAVFTFLLVAVTGVLAFLTYNATKNAVNNQSEADTTLTRLQKRTERLADISLDRIAAILLRCT